jgi:hypothetical protein
MVLKSARCTVDTLSPILYDKTQDVGKQCAVMILFIKSGIASVPLRLLFLVTLGQKDKTSTRHGDFPISSKKYLLWQERWEAKDFLF